MFMKDFTRLANASATAVSPAAVLTTPVTSGIVAGTLLEGACGWLPVEALKIGDAVQTLDGGLVRILGLDRRVLHPETETALVQVPGGDFDACSDVTLMPGQHLLVDTLGDAAMPDELYALIPAAALIGRHGATRHFPPRPVEVITLLMAEEEIVWANSGLMIHCPAIATGANRRPGSDFFARLDPLEARAFLARREARLSEVA